MRDQGTLARVFVTIVTTIVLLPFSSTPVSAQRLPLAQVLPDLILRDIVLLPGMLGPAHNAHFSPLTNDPNNPVIGIVQAFNTQMAKQFSTFPLGSSAGGLTYVFDESVGTLRRSSARRTTRSRDRTFVTARSSSICAIRIAARSISSLTRHIPSSRPLPTVRVSRCPSRATSSRRHSH